MEWLQQLIDSDTTPFMLALLMGLLHTISPCELATNVTAIGYIGSDLTSRDRIFWSGILYTLGRVLVYTMYGLILIPVVRSGSNAFMIQKFISKYGEMLLAPSLILIGLAMLFGDKLHVPRVGFKGSDGERFKGRGYWGAFLLGLLFSLAFCPTSGVFYFGMLIPMSAGESGMVGYLLPIVYALATAIPVMFVSWVLAYSVSEIGRVYNRIQTIQRWVSRSVAVIFILVGVYYAVNYFI